MNALCLSLILCVHIYICLAYERDFYAEITADELVYVAVQVPRYARYFEVQIWAEASELNPTVLLRYDGLPTTKLFDAKLTIPSPPSALQLIDLNPTQSVLYLGIYGGSKLHRFRYFAGEATKVLIGVEANVTSCPNEFQRGSDCALVDLVATAVPAGFSLTANTTKSHLIVVPSHSERLQLDIATADLSHICEELRASNVTHLEVAFELYLDQPAEENNSARQVQAMNHTSLCAANSSSVKVASTLTVDRPLPGVWTLTSTLRVAAAEHSSANTSTLRNSIDIPLGEKSFQVRLVERGLPNLARRVPVEMPDAMAGGIALPLEITSSLTTSTAGRTTSATFSSSSPTEDAGLSNASCAASVVSMSSVRTPLVAHGVYSMHASPTTLQSLNLTATAGAGSNPTRASCNPFVVFEAQLPSQVQLMAVGGGLVVQVTVGLSDTSSDTSGELFSLVDNLHFLVAVRFGGLPADPDVYDFSKAGSDAHARSPNAFLLSSRVAVIRDSPVMSASSDDDATDVADSAVSEVPRTVPHRYAHWATVGQAPPSAENRRYARKSGSSRRTFSWAITRPALPNLFASSLGSGDAPMFLRVSREPLPSSHAGSNATPAPTVGVMHGLPNHPSLSHARERLSSLDLGVALEVSASVVFEPCPESSCVHGQCFTQTGDVPAYSCSCTYPWAGESCDSLSVPYGFYVVQVLVLTLSNLAMVPAVLLSLAGQLPFVGTLLGLSSAASAAYHLCDIDVYCTGGLSFHSLQVMDILFSICAISCILLLYAPVTRSCHAALSLLCIGLLVPPVADLPTSPANLALSLTFALTVLALGWGLVLNSSVKRGRGVHVVGGMFVNSTTDPFLCDVSTLSGRQNAPSSTTIGRETGARSSAYYASVAYNSPDVSSHDVEMIALGSNSADDDGVDPADPTGVLGDDPPCLTLCAPGVQRVWLVPAVGLSIGLAGLMCFALQARESYYILHSMWHVFMMIAAYFLVKGRIELYSSV